MSHYYQTNAITLSRQDARENDRVFSFYTEGHGKVLAQVTSAKKIKSRLSGHLEPFGIVEIGVVKGIRKNRLASARAKNRYENIFKNIEKIFCAGYCLRLVDEIVREGVSDNKIYTLLHSGLKTLDTQEINGSIKIFNAIFTVKLLAILGYQPQVENCIGCAKPLIDGNNIFSIKRGGVVCAQCADALDSGTRVCPNDIKLLRLVLRLEMIDILKLRASASVFKKFNTIVAEFLKFHLH
ncbi:MAG: repair protein RecO protein [Parcubacteria group bacterium GW2011_GWA2_38_13]|nr:MAG: repair protein RecO protein [Parcubacteria group bacterium GW2011_GWA2_38_13]